MNRYGLVAALALTFATTVAAQSITVTKPAEGDTCRKGGACPINWYNAGGVLSTAEITLRNAADTADVLTIAASAPNCAYGTCSYAWTPPASLAQGAYRVRVKSGSAIGTSGKLAIVPAIKVTRQPGTLPPPPTPTRRPMHATEPIQAVKEVKVTYPATNVEWELKKPYTIRWTANTAPDDGFKITLKRYPGGAYVDELYYGAATSTGPGAWSYTWTPWCNLSQTHYRITITSLLTDAEGKTGVFKLIVKPKTTTDNIPVQVENADIFYSNIGSVLDDCTRNIPPGKARVGYDLSEYRGKYSCHVFRARLTFDLSRYAGKNGVVEKATIVLGDHEQTAGCGALPPTCVGWLYALNAGEDARWNTFQAYATAYQFTGWSTPFAPPGWTITEAVNQWIKGAKPKLGVVVDYPPLPFNCGPTIDQQKRCPSFFKPIMYVTFVETPDPCAP